MYQDLFCWHRKTMEVPMMLVVFVKGGTFLTSQAEMQYADTPTYETRVKQCA